ncbi:MAG: hypothetical protein JXK93_11955 [Sphaerochaetaceae bacterium]|nr:hypothetical protein [Sphaerochaetaceae bacterium]
MNLRTKTLVVMLGSLFALMAIVFGLSSVLFLNSYAASEELQVKDDLDREIRVLENDLGVLSSNTLDWATWDEMYWYLNGENPGFSSAYLGSDTFSTLNIDYIVLIDDDGRVIESLSYNQTSGEVGDAGATFTDSVSGDAPLITALASPDGSNGLWILEEQIVLLASAPATDPESDLPPSGTLVMGRLLDQQELNRLSSLTGLPFAIVSISDPGMPAIDSLLKGDLSNQQMAIVQVNDSLIKGYSILSDIIGTESFILETEIPRTLYAQGAGTVAVILPTILLIGIVLGIVAVILIDRLVLGRLTSLHNQVKHIGGMADPSLRVSMKGGDELQALADVINRLLERIDEAQAELRESMARTRALFEAVPDIIVQVNRDGTILAVKPGKNMPLPLPPELNPGKSLGSILSKEFSSSVTDILELSFTSEDVQIIDFEYEMNGVKRQFEARVVAVNLEMAIALVRDETARRLAEVAIKRANEKLNLLSSITRHDILNQVMALLGNIYLAGDHCTDETSRELLKAMKTIGETIQSQVVFTRDYQQLGISGPGWLRISLVIKNARSQLDLSRWHILEETGEWEVFADQLFVKVIYNLMQNTLKHAGETADTIRIRCEESDVGLHLIYEDNGVGIADRARDGLFIPASNGEHGFGLFLASEILSITGATIAEEGSPGRGVRFRISFQPGTYRREEREGVLI